MSTYAVAWRDLDGSVSAGKLELGKNGIRLEAGRHRDGRVSVLSLLYRDLTRVEMAPAGKRLSDRPTLALTATRGLLYIAPVGIGVAREVLGLLQLGDAGAES